MKIRFLLTLTASAVLYACSNETPYTARTEIAFLPEETRSGAAETETGQEDFSPFGVSASLGGNGSAVTDYMWNMKVSFTGGKWRSSSPIYWMNSAEIRFFATYPYIEHGNSSGISLAEPGAEPSLTYDAPDEASEHTDILAASASGNSGSVSFKFSHILASIGFRIGKEFAENTSISSIRLHDAIGKATYDMDSGEWKDYETRNDFIIGGIGFTMHPDFAENTPVTPVKFMIPPQTFPEDSQAYIEITLSDNGSTVTGNIPLAGTRWKKGVQYTYRLNYAGGIFNASALEGFHPAGNYTIDERNETKE